jgi:hypothetical protein
MQFTDIQVLIPLPSRYKLGSHDLVIRLFAVIEQCTRKVGIRPDQHLDQA